MLQEDDAHVFEVPEGSATARECSRYRTYLGFMNLRTLLDLLAWPRTWTPEKSNVQTHEGGGEGGHAACVHCNSHSGGYRRHQTRWRG